MIDLLPSLLAGNGGGSIAAASIAAMAAGVLSVSEATAHIKSLLDDDPTLTDCWIRGEVSDPRTYNSGHTYFTLRDGTSQMRCVLFRQKARGLEPLVHGRQYVVHGAISIYEAQGAYQLYVTNFRTVGTGELYQQFELLKAKLEANGLFAPERKRPLPVWPQRIGVATSAQGAVIHDLRQVIGRRYPLAEIVLAPCQVQGAEAVRAIVASIRALDAAQVDVIVVARGGGSIEDLWAYNEEAVALAIAGAGVPVVSAVGHETDFTIADFVADVRAPTPSVAGELLVPDAQELQRALEGLVTRAERSVRAHLWEAQNDLIEREQRLQRLVSERFQRTKMCLEALLGRLQALSPLAVLGRGYAVVRDQSTGNVLRSVSQATQGQCLTIRFADGALTATVDTSQQAGRPTLDISSTVKRTKKS